MTGNWLGLIAYAKHQFNDKFALAGRIEQFEDTGRTGGITPRYGFGGNYLKLNEATLTAEYLALKGKLVTRLEYRHDWGSSPIYVAGSGSVVKDQDTLSLSFAYKF